MTPAPQFLGRQAQPDDILLRLTRFGDANLDGTVNLVDFNRLPGSFGQSVIESE